MCIYLKSHKIRKIPSLVDFHSLYHLLPSQVYHNKVGINFSEFYHEKVCEKNLLVLVSCQGS